MNRITTIILVSALAAGAQIAHAADPADASPRHVKVLFSDLNLTSIDGASTLYRRLQGAAESVCAEHGTRDVKSVFRARTCGKSAAPWQRRRSPNLQPANPLPHTIEPSTSYTQRCGATGLPLDTCRPKRTKRRVVRCSEPPCSRSHVGSAIDRPPPNPSASSAAAKSSIAQPTLLNRVISSAEPRPETVPRMSAARSPHILAAVMRPRGYDHWANFLTKRWYFVRPDSAGSSAKG